MLKTAIVGATGYTGLELLRLLQNHPQVKLTALTSERLAGQKFSNIFPRFSHEIDLKLQALDPAQIAEQAELAFLCLPHQTAMEAAKNLRAQNLKVIDLSADFRLHDPQVYQAWYDQHLCPELLQEAVYGLPELHREKIKQANLIANPGCYPTSCILGLAPLVQSQVIDLTSLHCDSKSGVSGAGRTATTANLFCEVNEGFKAYKVGAHRHTPEIEQELSQLAGQTITLSFTPHLIPMNRGILSTLYAKPKENFTSEKLHQLYTAFYQDEPFVRVRPLGSFPSTQEVYRTNYCDLGVHYDPRTQRIIIVSVLDNLTKGAAGQAIQNMNLLMGWKESEGLH